MEEGGVKVFVPTVAPQGFSIIGTDAQLLQIEMQPGQDIVAEPGAMVFGSDGMKAKARLGGAMQAVRRGISGESFFKTIWSNSSDQPGFIALAAGYPATIIPIDPSEYPHGVKCKQDAFMAGKDPNTQVSISLLNASSCLACCCSGMDMVMQHVTSTDWSFLASHGTIIVKDLAQDESIIVDTNAVVAVSPTIQVDVRCVGGCKMCCCGSEGLFNTALIGPGKVILTSMPLEKVRTAVVRELARQGKLSTGGAGVDIGGGGGGGGGGGE